MAAPCSFIICLFAIRLKFNRTICATIKESLIGVKIGLSTIAAISHEQAQYLQEESAKLANSVDQSRSFSDLGYP